MDFQRKVAPTSATKPPNAHLNDGNTHGHVRTEFALRFPGTIQEREVKAPYFPFSANLPQERSGRPAGSPEPRRVAPPRPFPELTADIRPSAPRTTGRSRGPSVRSGTSRGRPTAARPEARARRACGRPRGREPRAQPPAAGRPAAGPAAVPSSPLGPAAASGPEEDGGDPVRARPRPPSQPPRAALTRHCSIPRRAPQPRAARTTTASSREPPGQLISPQRRSRDGGAGRGVESSRGFETRCGTVRACDGMAGE